jgi:excisionase family DNA binding protein
MSATVRFAPEVMTYTQAAVTVGRHPRTIRRWVDEGRLPSVRLPSGRPGILDVDLRRAVERPPNRSSGRSAALRSQENDA